MTKYWAIWAHPKGNRKDMRWLDWVYRSRYSRAKAELLGKRILRAWKMRGFVVEIRPFESGEVRPLSSQNLFNAY